MSEDCSAPHPAYTTPCQLPAGHGNAHEGVLTDLDGEPVTIIWLAPRSRRTS